MKKDENKNTNIITRTHRISKTLHDRIIAESDKTGNPINNEINSLIFDGLRLREAKIIIQS